MRTRRWKGHRSRARFQRLALGVLTAALVVVAGGGRAVAGKVRTWSVAGAKALAAGAEENVVVADTGRVRLSRPIHARPRLEAARVWDLARGRDGAVYAATGDAGRVFRLGPGADTWEVVLDAADSQALALAVLPDGRVMAGTGPSGQVVDVGDAKHPASRPGDGVQYVWDLAVAPDGSLLAATGPGGQLWRRSVEGNWSLVFDSPQPHLLCLAVGPDGTAYAGSDGAGLIYRIRPDGTASVLFDAPRDEVRSLVLAPDGTLFAGTAGAEGGGGSSSRTTGSSSESDDEKAKSSSASENAVYRVGVDGSVREILRIKAMILALAWSNERLLVGAGSEGGVLEVTPEGRESSPVARLDASQVLAFLKDPDGSTWIGAGDPARAAVLGEGFVTAGSLTSEVFDTKLVSRFGAIGWSAETPAKTRLSVQIRTGNTSDPDATWSPWSPARTEPEAREPSGVPPGRFVQARLNLATDQEDRTPEARSFFVRYQTMNLAPEVESIEVPDLSEGDGATREDTLKLEWKATDPNDDDLEYRLAIRKEGWPDWLDLTAEPVTETNYSWDTTTLPGGRYRVRVIASDRPSNAAAEAMSHETVSETFVLDHTAPEVTITVAADRGTAAVRLRDAGTRLVKAAYAIDGGSWKPAFPSDGLFDATEEALAIALPDLAAGVHVLAVRATDAAGNTGVADAVITAPSP